VRRKHKQVYWPKVPMLLKRELTNLLALVVHPNTSSPGIGEGTH
jgi:hypothetical protein